MNQPILVIINGAPGAGKTTLGKHLTRELKLPFLSKDDIKETLFDTLGWQDREWSMKLGTASMAILFQFLERQLEVGKSLIVETAFIPRFHTKPFLELKNRYAFEPFQILCWADERVLFERYSGRYTEEKRHSGHVDHLVTWNQFAEVLQGGKYGILDIGGSLVEVDTTDFNRIDYESLLNSLRTKIS